MRNLYEIICLRLVNAICIVSPVADSAHKESSTTGDFLPGSDA